MIDVTEDLKAPVATASIGGIKDILKMFFKRKQKSGDASVPINLPNIEKELQYHILNNQRCQELLDLLSASADKVLLEELIELLKTAPLSRNLRDLVN